MAIEKSEDYINRRNFLKAAAVTAVAATATGAGIALLGNKSQPAPALPAPSLPPAAQTVVNAPSAASDLFAQLAASQAENVRLQATLDAAQRRLEALQLATTEGNSATEALSVELSAATERISLLSGLVALYEQLDGVDVADVLDEGMAAVATTLSDLLDDVPTLSEGVEMGRQALAEIEEHIPLLENGRTWLDNQTSKLQTYYEAIKALLETAVDAAGPFLQMLNEWFQKIRKWLPFGLGQTASEIMVAISNLLSEMPTTISGLNSNIAQPLDAWLAGETAATPLHQKLIKPMREQVLDKADGTMDKVRQVETSYQTQLAQPARAAVNSQSLIRALIAQYRQQHKIEITLRP